jgi:hypothetical protein
MEEKTGYITIKEWCEKNNINLEDGIDFCRKVKIKIVKVGTTRMVDENEANREFFAYMKNSFDKKAQQKENMTKIANERSRMITKYKSLLSAGYTENEIENLIKEKQINMSSDSSSEPQF